MRLKDIPSGDVMGHIKNLLNYVEDRRIDNFVFTSQGLQGLLSFHGMTSIFIPRLSAEDLDSDEHTEENMESYMFRIINLTNKNTNLSAPMVFVRFGRLSTSRILVD